MTSTLVPFPTIGVDARVVLATGVQAGPDVHAVLVGGSASEPPQPVLDRAGTNPQAGESALHVAGEPPMRRRRRSNRL